MAGAGTESPRDDAAAGDGLATGDVLETLESVRAGDSP
jgi:hypothetical protein